MKDHNSTPTTATPKANPPFKQRVSPPMSSAPSTAYRSIGSNVKTKSAESMKSDGLISSPPSSAVTVRAKSTVMRERRGRRSLRPVVVESDVSVKLGSERRLRPVVVEHCVPRTTNRGGTTDRDGVVEVEVKLRLHELEEKVDVCENVIKELRLEIVNLRDELDDAKALNSHLQLINKGLCADLHAAKAQIAALTESQFQVRKESMHESHDMDSNDNQKFTSSRLMKVSNSNEVNSGLIVDNGSKKAVEKRGVPASTPLAPPPPPLPSRHRVSASAQQPAAIVELYRSLSKPEARKDSSKGNGSKGVFNNVHNSIVGEIQNRSTHLMAIKIDIETKGDFINSLISKVLSAAYTDIEDVLQFVDWLDNELSSLADERSVLKHFPWPEKKADAMREAAIEYRDLKLLEQDISSYEIDAKISCEFALKKLAALLDKCERSIQRLVKLRSSVMVSYRNYNIPTEWMLDSGFVSKIKHASMKLANLYMKRVTMELHAMRFSDREYAQEALLLQGVHFAYKIHQFAGGLDSDTLCAFEELRDRIPGHLIETREIQSSILSS